MRRVGLVLAGLCIAASALARQQPRDPRQPPGGGQPSPAPRPSSDTGALPAAITGIVLSDDRPPQPLRRARVSLNGSGLAVGRTVITGDDGSFAFERLTPGSYSLAAAKDGYVALNHGAKRAGRSGVPIAIGRGERRQVRFALVRGGVITGSIMQPDGEPAAGIDVTAVLYRYAAGERVPVSTGVMPAVTDDRGVYRIFGLPAGDYIVAARTVARDSDAGDLQLIPEAEIRRALAEVRDPFTRAPSRPLTAPDVSASATGDPPRPLRFASVYYPGTALMSHAALVTLGPAEERRGADFALEYAQMARVSGTLVGHGGLAQQQILLIAGRDGAVAGVTRTTVASPNGEFAFAEVPPGPHTLMTRSVVPFAPTSGPATAAAPEVQWASTDVFVDGEDVMNVVLTMNASLTMRGRVAFQGSSPLPALAGVRVLLPEIVRAGSVTVPEPSLRLAADGRFILSGIIPGAYGSRTIVPGQRAPIGAWWLKSVVVNGREILDTPLDLHGADDVVVTFSDRATELRGALKDPKGSPDSSHAVVVFGLDPASWFFNSRRVAGIQPDADGRFVIRNLPPGEYFVAALDDLEPGECYDPAVLQPLVNGAMRVTLADGEKKTLDVVVRAGQGR